MLGFGIVATVLGTATLAAVYRIMSDFRAELMHRPGAADDPALLDAIAYEANTMHLILAAILLIAALYIAAGFTMILRRQPR